MNNYIQPGKVITLTAPAGGVTSGGGYQIGQIFVVAANDADAAADFEGQTEGVFTLPKDNTQAWSEGDLLYWDATADEVSTSADGNMRIGCAAADALAADTTGSVRLDGVGQPDGVTFAMVNAFVSTEQTGDGTEQSIAHGLGATPAAVLIVPTDTAPATAGDYTATEGTHDATSVLVTVTTGKKYKVFAWA